MSPPKRKTMNKQTAVESAPNKIIGSERNEAGDIIYERIQTGLRFELELMNTRVNWLLNSQAFLFVPLVIGAQGRPFTQNPLFPHLPLLGLGLCLILTLSILAAGLRMTQWRSKLLGTVYADEQTQQEYSGVMPNTPLIPIMALTGAFGVPIMLIAAWSWLLLLPPP